jgi:hypothetical protein
MGVDTKLYIGRQWSLEDIKDVIEKRFSVPVTFVFHDFAPDYVSMKFKLTHREYERELHVHTHTFVGGLPAIGLGFRSNPESTEVLRTLAKTFGGLFQEEDTTDIFQEYSKPGEGNIDFVIKQAIKDDPKLGHDDEGIVRYIAEKKWSDNKVWPRPIKLRE